MNLAYGIAAADLDGDGAPDLVVGVDKGLVVYSATPGARFRTERRIPLLCQVFDVAIADFNKDTHLDVTGYCLGEGLVFSMIGDGAGAFSDPRRSTLVASVSRGMATADLNQDGWRWQTRPGSRRLRQPGFVRRRRRRHIPRGFQNSNV